METILKIIKSRQMWTIVATIIVNGVPSVSEFISADWLPWVNTALTALIIYFRIIPKQRF